ncbi:TlpA family protein disulfide reductase [Algoriphagus persicinus]|uniref:TlpA family protein disulfide reductase n=1 Tax=Algoriphagus persicinus TaxID=3108754 RepID=UPI002B36CC5A|nr:thioredoxin-like domain-containing protein [Algoriphagus sp. E1-3-M2]MEB2787352.1 thioredoxin-like domain-containing protein [Algoriphagus sp. E1-3-M2]
MKKLLLICLLGYLCVPTSTSTAQVAESPPGTDLVYQPGFPGQEGESPSARLGALIYGELINPDSLTPLKLVFSPFSKELGQTLPDSSMEISTTHGTFFDGVLDPRVRKFRVRLPEATEMTYFSLYLNGRPLIEDFLISPQDSIKIGIDLQRSTMIFGGPQGDWMEAQYLVGRDRKQQEFDSPRALIEKDKEKYLDQEDYRAQLKEASQEFGASLQILELGKDHIDRDLATLLTKEEDIPGMRILNSRKKLLTPAQYMQLRENLLGSYYARALSSIRRYGYLVGRAQNNLQAVGKIERTMPEILLQLKSQMEGFSEFNLSSGGIYFYKEWANMAAVLREEKFSDLVLHEFTGKIKNLLLYTYAMELVSRQQDPVQFLSGIIAKMDPSSYQTKLEKMEIRLSPQQPLRYAQFSNLEGMQMDTEDLKGKATLLYFYFSTCTHSANFFRTVLLPIYQEGINGLEIVAVSVDNDPILWKEQLSAYSDPVLTNLRLPSQVWRSWLDHYLITGYPRTMLIDPAGKVLSIWVPGRTEESFRTSLQALLQPVGSKTSTLKPSQLQP